MENGAFAPKEQILWKMEHLLQKSKYYGKWSICSKRANAPFSIIFSQTCQKALLWSEVLKEMFILFE